MCWNRPLRYSCGCLAPFLVKEECELASHHQANYVRTPEEAGYPCDAHNRRRGNSQGFRTTQNTNHHNLPRSYNQSRRTSSNRIAPIGNAFDEHYERIRRERSRQSQQEVSSGRFRSASHNRTPIRQDSSRPPTTRTTNRIHSDTGSRPESRDTRSRPANENRSRSPQNRRPILRTPSNPRSDTIRQAYETMMTNINDDHRPTNTRNNRGNHYRSRSPPPSGTHRPIPRSTPRPAAQLSPFDPRSTVFREAYDTMMTDITDEEIRRNIPDVDDEMFLSEMEEMVRDYLPENYGTRRPSGSYR